MHGRLAAPEVGVVEGREIVVDERGAMQQLDGDGGGLGSGGVAVAAGAGHGEHDLRADAMAAGEHRIAQGAGEKRRGLGPGGLGEGMLQGLFDARGRLHSRLPMTI